VKFRIVEDGAEEALGQQVLHQHLIDGVGLDVGVQRGRAEGIKADEGQLKTAVLLMLAPNQLLQTRRQFGDALLELADGGVEALDDRLAMREEQGEQVGQLARLRQVRLDSHFAL